MPDLAERLEVPPLEPEVDPTALVGGLILVSVANRWYGAKSLQYLSQAIAADQPSGPR